MGRDVSNVSDFDGATTLGVGDFGGSGEFLVRVGTENRMQVLGHISLLGYAGVMIQPLCTGGPSQSATGDPQEVTMADWATRCLEQGGPVVMPHAPNPQCERAADIVLGVVGRDGDDDPQPVPRATQSLRHRRLVPLYLNLGYRLPVVGGSDKMAAASQLGGVRTYIQLGEREFTHDNWMAALRAGNTFVTVGPLAELTVKGRAPGAVVEARRRRYGQRRVARGIGQRADLDRRSDPRRQVAEEVDAGGALGASGAVAVRVDRSSWLALRVRGGYQSGRSLDIAAHTSAVQVRIGGARPFSAHDADLILDQIEGALAYVDTIAPRPDARRYRQLRATLEGAWNRLPQTMHRHGVFHHHTLLHDHAAHHEHWPLAAVLVSALPEEGYTGEQRAPWDFGTMSTNCARTKRFPASGSGRTSRQSWGLSQG